MAEKCHATHDPVLCDDLFRMVSGEINSLVRILAHRYFSIPIDEMRAECYVAFMESVRDFDSTLGKDFMGYLTVKCRSRLKHYLRDKVRLIRIPPKDKGFDYSVLPFAYIEADLPANLAIVDSERTADRKHKPSVMDEKAVAKWQEDEASVGDTPAWQLIVNAIAVMQAGGSARNISHALGIRQGSSVAHRLKTYIRRYLNNEEDYADLDHDPGCWPLRYAGPGANVVSGLCAER